MLNKITTFFCLGILLFGTAHTAEASRLRKARQPIQEITYTSFDATELSKIIEEFRLNNGELPHNKRLIDARLIRTNPDLFPYIENRKKIRHAVRVGLGKLEKISQGLKEKKESMDILIPELVKDVAKLRRYRTRISDPNLLESKPYYEARLQSILGKYPQAGRRAVKSETVEEILYDYRQNYKALVADIDHIETIKSPVSARVTESLTHAEIIKRLKGHAHYNTRIKTTCLKVTKFLSDVFPE